jgi:pimeloyl-ACP methyl ester carboxylesterase
MASLRRREEAMLLEAGRSGVAGAVHEVGLLVRPWHFSASGIRARVDLFHGRQDDTAPLRHAQRLAGSIPGSRLHICEGEGHMVMWTHLHEILAAALGRPLPERPSGTGPPALAGAG